MLTTSSEEEDYDSPVQSQSNIHIKNLPWKESDFRSTHTLDLRSKYQDHTLLVKRGTVLDSEKTTCPSGDRPPLAGKPDTGWQPLQSHLGYKVEDPVVEAQRAPMLSALSGVQHEHEITSGANEGISRKHYSTQFSVSFEGISEAGPMGTRLSPVGSSCWSSEQHLSPDLVSLVSGSTNSFSASRSVSSVKQHAIVLAQHLQRQPSSGTGGSGGHVSTDAHLTPSTSQSIRSAPLCLGSPVQTTYFRQLTLDVQPPMQPEIMNTPSLIVTDSEDAQHRRRLQIYVFAIRCVAYPILNPISQGPIRRYMKVTQEYLRTLRERFQSFVNGEMPISCDEAFRNAISIFYEVVLESDRIASMVKSGCCSMYDLREIFITTIEKRFQNEPMIEGLSRESVTSAWKVKFDQICRGGERPCPVAMKLAVPQPENVTPTKEQQYELLMRTLLVEKYEHQVLYNACQLDNTDEQAAQLRRELSERLSMIEKIAKDRSYPKLVHKEMETQYIEEERHRVNELIRRLDSIPVLKGYTGSSTDAHPLDAVTETELDF